MICPLCYGNTRGIKVIRMLTVSELSKILDVSRETVYRWERGAILPPRIILGPSMSGWREEDLAELKEYHNHNIMHFAETHRLHKFLKTKK